MVKMLLHLLLMILPAYTLAIETNFHALVVTDSPENLVKPHVEKALKQYQNTTRKIQLQFNVISTDEPYAKLVASLPKRVHTNTIVIMAIGSQKVIHACTLLSKLYRVPVLTYSPDYSGFSSKSVGPPVIQFDGSKSMLARFLLQIFAKYSWYSFSVVFEEHYIHDGFIPTLVSRIAKEIRWRMNNYIKLRSDDSFDTIVEKLSVLRRQNSKIVVLHCTKKSAPMILRAAMKAEIFSIGYAWFTSDSVITDDPEILKQYPVGLISLDFDESHHSKADMIFDMVHLIYRTAKSYMQAYQYYFLPMVFKNMSLREQYSYGIRMYRKFTEAVFIGNTGLISFDKYGSRQTANVAILNLQEAKNVGKVWRRSGLIVSENFTGDMIDSIIWPGNTLKGPQDLKRNYWTVVTTIIKPFVIEEKPIGNRCLAYTACLRVATKDPQTIASIFDDYREGLRHNSRPYSLSCCKGLSIDILEKISTELNFKYQLYIVADNKSGARKGNGSWNGMVADLVSRAADMAIAAFSITQVRSKAIDFSSPYFYSGLSMMSVERERPVPLHAFLEPIDSTVWYGILLMAVIVAVSLALFEWNSPFGLNPWGRKRKINYTLASAFNAVFAILFGHTVKSKSPKSWPCKFVQNFWAATSIFILASYTANLAAFIAGKTDKIFYSGIQDPKLMKIKVGVKDATSGENYVKIINNDLYERVVQHNLVATNREGFNRLNQPRYSNGSLDIYLGDTPVLEYQKSEQDPDCRMKIVGRSFGDDGYGIGFPKNSWLKDLFSQKIMEYHETGYLERLRKNYFYLPVVCFNQKGLTPSDLTLKFENHAGLYVTLAMSILICIFFLLPIEHIVFQWVVPYIRTKPSTSKWKNLNMMFVSQRLYRIVTAKELLSANHAFKEMANIIKEKQFGALFQKNQKKQLEEAMKSTMQRKKFRQIIDQLKQQIIYEQSLEENPEGERQAEGENVQDNFIEVPDEHKSLTQYEDGRRQSEVNSKTPNGRLPDQIFLSPTEFLPWNAFGNTKGVKTLASMEEEVQGQHAKNEPGPECSEMPQPEPNTAPPAMQGNVNEAMDLISLQNLPKETLVNICVLMQKKLEAETEEKNSLKERLKQRKSYGRRTRSNDRDGLATTDEIFL